MKRYWWVIPGVLLVVAFAGLLKQTGDYREKLGRAELASARADSITEALTGRVVTLAQYTEHVRDSLTQELARQQRRKVVRDTVIREIIAQADTVCAPVVEQLLEVQRDRDSALTLVEAMRQVNDSLAALHLLDSTMLDAERLAHRESLAAAHASPAAPLSFFKRLIPKVGVGATAGWSLGSNRPDITLGLTGSWTITP